MTILDQVDVLTKQFKSLQPLTKENRQRLEKKFRLEFNYNSNHLEGNTLTYSETELLLILDDTRGNHTMREYEEMKHHDVAFKLIEEWAGDTERTLTEQNIKNLNEIILVRPFWKDAITPDGQNTRRLIKIGNYKEHPNSVRLQNGEIFNYTSPTDTPIMMKELLDWYRGEEKTLHPVMTAAMLHYKFVRIHPFDDGNGRVARLLMNYVLLRNELPPVIIKSDDKVNYLRALRSADVGNYEPLILYTAEQVIWSLQISIKAAKGESIDEPGDLDKKLQALKKRVNIDANLRVQVTKNLQSIKTAYELSIYPLISSLTKKLSEFLPLFKSTSETFFAYNSSGGSFRLSTGVQTFQSEIAVIPGEIVSLVYNYSLQDFQRAKKTISAGFSLKFVLHKIQFEIESEAIKTQIGMLYDTKFLDSEIADIVEQIGNYVIENIETQLDN